ncbi:general odorant-binding protein 83a-like [Diabrotica undecimpunctata]|uniref:general odorant-binding protein 83a-like n=1 Tax=Diabrotica undecimpunctata TaxID=50387 RepID=UPI003B63F861
MFKTLGCFFALVVLVAGRVELPPELQEYVKDLHNICIAKAGITEGDHAAYDIENNPHDPKLMCYMKCLMLEAKWMAPDGAIQYDFISNTAHPKIKDLLVSALNKCRTIEDGANLCEKASNLNFCLHKADPENWFLV